MSQRRIFLAAGSCSNAYANISVVYLLVYSCFTGDIKKYLGFILS